MINYKNYHPKWKKISLFIRKYRAHNKCEWCGVENYSIPIERNYKIILTVAHLDHNINNNSFFNLAALCQRCHLQYDAKTKALNRRYGKVSLKNQYQLFLGV